MTSDRFTFHCFLAGRSGHCNLGENGKIVKFTIQVAFATTSCGNRHKISIQLEATNFVWLIHHVINCQSRSPKCPLKIRRCFILGHFNGIIFIINLLSTAFNEKRHIISNFFPLITLVIGILDFICLSEKIFKSLPCNINLSRSS